MEQPHLSAQLEYLEQKNQKAQGQIARLQQRVEHQEYQLQEQQQQIRTMAEQLEKANSQVARVPQLDEQLRSLKDELLHLVDQRLSRYQPAPSANSTFLKQQLDNHTQTLSDIGRDLEKMRRYEDQIALARAESGRLGKEVGKFQMGLDSLGRELDERIRPLTYLEDQRRSDVRTLAELQAGLPELYKKVETSLTKAQLIEQKIPQYAKYEAALDSMREEIRRHREHMDFQMAQRERQLKDWTGLAEATEQRLKENESAMVKYSEHYQLNKRALASLQEFQERLEHDQHRLGELQRLAEERQRSEMEKFQADYEQRWQRRSMDLEPQFVDIERSIDALSKRIDRLVEQQRTLTDQMSIVLQIIEEDIQSRTLASNSWLKRFEEIANGQA